MDGSAFVPRWCSDPRSRQLAAVGVGLVASGVAHAVVWAVDGGPWEGPVTWRKPILFGVSGGLTALSLGWAWSKLPWRPGDAWLAAATAWALAVEVGLIDLQRWRGVASHFNRGTPLDSFLYDLMGGLILGVALVVVDLTIRFLIGHPRLTADMLLAARTGLILLAVSCLLGVWIGVHGDLRVAAGLSPETVGTAGVAKFPHGVAIHAVQSLPLVAWAARRGGLGQVLRLRLVAAAAVGTALVLSYSLLQTLAGRGRFDATPAAAALLAVGVAGVAVPTLVACGAAIGRMRRGRDASAGGC